MGALLVVGGAYFVYCLVKAKKDKADAIRDFENLPVGPEEENQEGEQQ